MKTIHPTPCIRYVRTNKKWRKPSASQGTCIKSATTQKGKEKADKLQPTLN